jgi:hypothetical protein
MIQERRDLDIMSQDEIGWELGLIVPPKMKSEFTKVRTGLKPPAGYGTQTSKSEFSIERYFDRKHLPLCITKVQPSSLNELISSIKAALAQDNDIVLCYYSQLLFGDADIEHVSLIEEFKIDSGQITVVDPAIGVPKRRITTISEVFKTIQNHGVSDIGELWIISERERDT